MVCLKNFTRPDKHREGKCLPRSHLLAPRNETKPEGGKSSDTLHRLRYSGPFCRCHTCLDYSKNIQTITVDVFGQTELPPPTKAQCFFFLPSQEADVVGCCEDPALDCGAGFFVARRFQTRGATQTQPRNQTPPARRSRLCEPRN